MNTRYARVFAKPQDVQPYLPRNYKIVAVHLHPDVETIISGEDVAGWTLDAYVIPRLGSGLIRCEETTA